MKANKDIAQFCEVLDQLNLAGNSIPGLIMSSPGYGKTTTVQMWCDYKDYNLVTLIASQYSQDDILGLQSVSPTTGKLTRLAPSWYNNMQKLMQNGKRTILFIDEITTCDEFIQAPLLNLIFNKSLGEQHLEDNVMILSAGNYAEELNNAFSMTAPLVNRFLILNITKDEFTLQEALDNDFDSLDKKDKNQLQSFLGLKQKSSKYSFDKFKQWLLSSGDVELSSGTVTNTVATGLLGFTSLRSINYAMKYAKMFFDTFADDSWTSVVGDSLGMAKREKPLRVLIKSNLELFEDKERAMEYSLYELSVMEMEYRKDPNSGKKSVMNQITEYITKHSEQALSAADTEQFVALCTAYPEDKMLCALNANLCKRMLEAAKKRNS